MTYTYKADLELERGPHELVVQVNNIWRTASTAPLTFQALYENTEPRMEVFQGDRLLEAWDITLHDATLPDLPSLSFLCAEEVTGNVAAIVWERGRKQYDFVIDDACKNAGAFAYQCVASERDTLEEQRDWVLPAGAASVVLPSLVPSFRVQGAEHMAGDVQRQQVSNATCQDLIQQLLTAGFCTGHVRKRTLWVNPLDIETVTERYAISRTDPDVDWKAIMRLYGKVRTHYANVLYPVPQTAITEYDAGNWTGTVINVPTTTVEGLFPPSGAALFLKATGAIVRTALSCVLSDFDRFRLNWKPDTTTSLTIKLEQDASNYLSYTRAFAGGTGSGFSVFGTGPGAEAVYSLAVGGRRIVYVAMKMSSVCSGKAAVLDAAGVTIYETGWRTASDIDNTLRIDFPASAYQAATGATTLVLTFNGLGVIGTQYGVQCTVLDIFEYVENQEWIPYETPGDYIANKITMRTMAQSYGYGTPRGGVFGQGVTYKLYSVDFGSVPALDTGQAVRIGAIQKVVTIRGTWWDSVTTHNTVRNFTVEPQVVIENGRIVGYFTIAFTNSTFANIGDLFMYEWVFDKYFEVIIWVVNVGMGASGTWGGTIWIVKRWDRAGTYYAFDTIDVPLASFTKTGTPTTCVSITLTATTVNYYDALNLYASVPIPRIAEAGNGTPLYDVRGVMFGSFSSALAYAQGTLALVVTPARQYQKEVGMHNDMDIGDVIACDGENMVISAIDYRNGGKVITAGRLVAGMSERLKGLARRLDAMEKIVL